MTSARKIVRLVLTPEQTKRLSPLAIEASANHENVLFVATVLPFWSTEDEATCWELQVAHIPAKAGHKVLNLIRSFQ